MLTTIVKFPLENRLQSIFLGKLVYNVGELKGGVI